MQPLLVGGTGCSGTTILMRCLLCHPAIAGRLEEQRLCDPDLQVAVPPIDAIRLHCDSGPGAWYAIKSQEAVVWFDRVRAVFPDVVGVHVFRHPLDTLASINRHARIGNHDEEGWRYWCASSRENALRIAFVYDRIQQQEHQMLHVSLEHLQADPQGTLGWLLAELGLQNYNGFSSLVKSGGKAAREELTMEQREEATPILTRAVRWWWCQTHIGGTHEETH